MKQIQIIAFLLLAVSCSNLSAQNTTTNLETQQKTSFDLDDLTDFLFEESDLFEERSFWTADYQLVTNLAEKSEDINTQIPAVGLHHERQLIGNLGGRISLGTNWWKEDIVLVESPLQQYYETFKFRYWTLGLGATWHFNTDGDKLDPYIGYMYSYRRIWASCDCISEVSGGSTHDLLIGARFFPSENFYVALEFGRQGIGYVGTGLGFAF